MSDKQPPSDSSAPEPSPDDQVTQDLSGSRWESTDEPAAADEPVGNDHPAIPPPPAAAGSAAPVAPIATTEPQRRWWRRTPAMIGGAAAAALLVGTLGFGVGYAVGGHGDDGYGDGGRGDGDFGRGNHGPGGFGGQQGQRGQLPPMGGDGQLDQDSDNGGQSDGSTESGFSS